LATLNGNLIPSTSTTYSDLFFLQATVAGASNQGTATGNITFTDTFNGVTSNLTTVPLSIQGSALVQETSLAVGTHTLTASYSGDPSFKASASSSTTVTVGKAVTATALLAPTGRLPGSSVTLEAVVLFCGSQSLGFICASEAVSATGTVQFFLGAQPIGSPVNLRNGRALLTTTQLSNGSNSITADYSGDGNFNASASMPRIVFIGNPDFQIAVNPGNMTVSAAAPGVATVLVDPSPGFGFAGSISFTCSGLPSGATCAVQPAQLNLNGLNPATAKLTITKSAQGLFVFDSLRRQLRFTAPIAALSIIFVLLLFLSRNTYRLRYAAFILLVCSLGIVGCSSSSSATPTGSSATPNFAVVTLTATGTNGFVPTGPTSVTHSVTLAVTLQ
jgi:hypothetical protein